MAETRITFHPERRGAGTLRLTETHWGYIVRESDGPLGGPAVAEGFLRFLGLVLVVAAYGQWLLPSSLYPADVVVAKAALLAVLAVAAAGLVLLANRGLAVEMQVDTEAREIRFARRSRRGRVRLLNQVPFSSVENVYVAATEGGAFEFRARLRGEGDVLHFLRGAERDLNLLHLRLSRDLKSPVERMEARLLVFTPKKVAVRARKIA